MSLSQGCKYKTEYKVKYCQYNKNEVNKDRT